MDRNVVVSFLGNRQDVVRRKQSKWAVWRPNVGLCGHPEFAVCKLYLFYQPGFESLLKEVISDLAEVAPETEVTPVRISFDDPWDFQEVYAKLYDWCHHAQFDTENFDYYFHTTTGTHVSKICSFLLTESHHFPGKLLQSSPLGMQDEPWRGGVHVIDLDLAAYEKLASRFEQEVTEAVDLLKDGIDTQNMAFNQLIADIEKVTVRTTHPILLTGPTGAGKSQLAQRIYQLKKLKGQVNGHFVVVNCATLKGENAMAALFGHTKGAFTGALSARKGFLKSADHGVLFLDEIGELGLEEQAMLLSAIETKRFYPVGSDQQVESQFQLITGTNRDLLAESSQGRFREDLLARIDLWSFELPPLRERTEDIPANIDYELRRFTELNGRRVGFNSEARAKYERFSTSSKALWRGNFRELSASITRLCTLADGARIKTEDVAKEMDRLLAHWSSREHQGAFSLTPFLTDEQLQKLDDFDQQQLGYVIATCRQHSSLASAGRALFNVSRTQKTSANDSSRLQKYLAKFGLSWQQISCDRTFVSNKR